jgi:hypothetical protein
MNSLQRYRVPALIVAGLLMALAARGVADAEDVPKPSESRDARTLGLLLSTTADYSQGKYGSGHTTQILRVPSTLTWSATDRLDLTLTIPYLWEHGRDILATVGAGSVWTSPRLRTRGITQRTQHARTEDGLGDILVDGEYVLVEERDVIPEVSPFVGVKFPTADSSTGLGTGEFDETLGVSLSKTFGKRWTASADLLYTFVGSPRHTTLDNFFGWTVGVSYDVTPSLRLATYLDGATAVSRHDPNPLDLRFQVEYNITGIVALTAGASAGLSHGSGDFGVSAGIKLRF